MEYGIKYIKSQKGATFLLNFLPIFDRLLSHFELFKKKSANTNKIENNIKFDICKIPLSQGKSLHFKSINLCLSYFFNIFSNPQQKN